MRLLVSVLLALAAPVATAAQAADPQNACIDPATPLRTLAAAYDRWPAAGATTERSAAALAKLNTYFRTGEDSDYRRALLAYRNMQTERPNDRNVRLALGILYASGPDVNFDGTDGYRHVAIINTSNADTWAARELQTSLAVDSTQWIAAIALTRIALVSPEKTRMPQARAAIQRALGASPLNTALHLAWRDLLIKDARHGDALDYLIAHETRCAGYQTAIAETLMLTGDTAGGSRLYLQTLDGARPNEIDRFYDDIRVMATVGQIRQFKATSPADRPRWIRAFWERTAAASGRTIETRVTEQTIRAAYADANYRSAAFTGNFFYGGSTRLAVISDTSHIVPWDAPGIYYVRHGPPDREYYADDGEYEYQGWAYEELEPPVVVLMVRGKHGFKKDGATGDWTPMTAPSCGSKHSSSFVGRFDVAQAERRIDSGLDMWLRDIYHAMSDIDPRYSDIIRGCMIIAANGTYWPLEKLQHEFAVENFHVLQKLSQTESSNPHFKSKVRMSIAAYQFRDANNAPEVIAISHIPVADLNTGSVPGRTLRLTYALTDSLTASLRTDTVVALPADVDGLVRVPVRWRSPAIASGRLRVTAVDPADSTVGATRSIAFALHADDGKIALSDVVFADVKTPGPLVRGSYRLSPLPGNVVQPGDAFRLFFELYGVARDEVIETTINVRNIDPKSIAQQLGVGKRDERTLSFNERAELDSRGVAVRDVEITGDLKPGNYAVDISVRTASGVIVRRSASLRVE